MTRSNPKKLRERLLAKTVIRNNGCWTWQGPPNNWGYGVIRYKYKRYPVHRLSYVFLKNKRIPRNFVVDHLCRQKLCINPDHLEAVTHGENVLRGEGAAAQNKRKTRCLCGRRYDVSNKRGHRRCSSCFKASQKRTRQKYLKKYQARDRKYYRENRYKIIGTRKQYQQAYYQRHRKRIREQQRRKYNEICSLKS